MKIVFINTLYAPQEIGGAERAVRMMAESVVDSGDEAVVITLAHDGKATFKNINGVRVYYVPLFNVGFLHGRLPLSKWRRLIWHIIDSYNPVMGGRVRRILKNEMPDVVEANNLQGFSVAAWHAASRIGLPVVQVIHDYYLACANSAMYRKCHNCSGQCMGCRMLCAPRRKFSHIPNVVSSVSQRTLDIISESGMFLEVAVRSIEPTGIDLPNFSNAHTDRENHATSNLVVGYLGRIEQVKGIDVLLEALRQIGSGRVSGLIAGGGNEKYLEELKSTYESDSIKFLGVVDASAFFARIDLLVVPSIWEEPLTRVIAEAYAAGIPVAVSRIGGMPEIVDEGQSGYVFEANSVPALKHLLENIPSRPLSCPDQIASRKKKSESFSIGSVYERHRKLWRLAMELNKNVARSPAK